jgi:hypothetical protein
MSMKCLSIVFRLPVCRSFFLFKIASLALSVLRRMVTCAARHSLVSSKFIVYCQVGEPDGQSLALALYIKLS